MELKKVKNYVAIILVLFLLFLLIKGVLPFISGFFGALILYTLFHPLHKYFVRKGVNNSLSAIMIIFISIFILLIPLMILLGFVGGDLISLIKDPQVIIDSFTFINEFIEKVFPTINMSELMNSQISKISEFSASLFFDAVTGAGKFIINSIIMYFVLFYMLIQEGSFFRKLEEVIPFNESNSKILTKEFKDITYTTIFSTGIIALIQGGLITITFLVFGVERAFLWGFIAAILSFFPIIGPPLIWIPASIIEFSTKNYFAGFGIFTMGIFLSNIDNFLRPYLQSKIGRIHPLTTLIGIFIGVPLFGLMGILIGPLMISYVLLTLEMFNEEYID